MSKFISIVCTAAVAVLVLACPAFAQGSGSAILNSAAIGVGLTVIGGAFGISRLAASALEGMARQPEAAGKIQLAMIIAAALIEGFTFYAIIVCNGKT